MKYKCLICGQIIESNDMCPICGSDSSQIVPLDEEEGKGHYRCLVCGRESDAGDYCPYCGSQRLFNLDTKKSTTYENEEAETSPIESTNNVEQNRVEREEVSLEARYLHAFGETLPLDMIDNPDVDSINSLYRMGLNRGGKISREEVLRAFNKEETDEQEIVEEQVEETSHMNFTSAFDKKEVQEEVAQEVQEEEVEDAPVEINSGDVLADLLAAIETLLHFSKEGNIAKVVLDELKNRILDEAGENKDVEELQENLIAKMEALIEHDKENDLATLDQDEKYLQLLKTIFGK